MLLLTMDRPNLDSVQALLMVGFVLLNDMKAEASWALLGLTCRLAQSLGLHRAQKVDGRSSAEDVKKEMSRRKLWFVQLSLTLRNANDVTGGHAYGMIP